jgi:hypothetical protein
MAARTPWLRQSLDAKHPKLYKLRKFTTMGSACTFPVETIGFFVCALASLVLARNATVTIKNLERLAGEIRVFGDDIIVPKEAGKVLEALLHHLEFEVNPSKTHRNGKFREACGMEAYDGCNVTPSYILQLPVPGRPESIASVVASSNNFYKRGFLDSCSLLEVDS